MVRIGQAERTWIWIIPRLHRLVLECPPDPGAWLWHLEFKNKTIGVTDKLRVVHLGQPAVHAHSRRVTRVLKLVIVVGAVVRFGALGLDSRYLLSNRFHRPLDSLV